ncbi:MAG TPA: hypothetical protein VGJ33_16265 [Candidatus Angelobacter sp.]|jgi:hypothetical protein
MSVQIVDRIAGDPLNIGFSANATAVQKIDKGYQVLAYMDVRLTGTLTLAGYTVPPTKLVESLENLISNMTVSATGKGSASTIGTIKSCDAAYYFRMTQFLESTLGVRVDVGTNNSAYNFETNFRVYFALPPRMRRIASLTAAELWNTHVFDARFVSNFTNAFNWRDQTAMVTGGTGGTATLSNVLVTVQVREITGWPSHDANKKPIIRPFVKEEQLLFDVTQTQQAKLMKDFPTGNIYRRITFKGTVGANPFSDPSDLPFANTSRTEGPHLTLKENNAFVFADFIYQQQRNENKKIFGIETMPAGYVVWEPSGGRNTKGVERLDFLPDVNFTGGQTNEIQATLQQIVS